VLVVSTLNVNSLGTDMAVVAVPVTAAWMHADASRPGDTAVTQPVPDMAAWMAALSHELRLDLLGRIATSALLGEPVVVVNEAKGWCEVRLPWQPSSLDPRGYPAWIPSAHLAPSSASGAGGVDGAGGQGAGGDSSVFCVTRRLVPVRATRNGPPVEVLSIGTRLPVVDVDPATGTNRAQVLVTSSMGKFWIDADCGVYASQAPPQCNFGPEHFLPRELIRTASEMLGTSYLWGGISGWGVDCSGLVHLAYRSLGVLVARDSKDQLLDVQQSATSYGREADLADAWQQGDQLFFRYQSGSNAIHHVGLAVSSNMMLHAPKTGRVVELLSLAVEPYASELVGKADPIPKH
jgi:gamma-D-glutamyl-L-lysine dipeptidyl-peptidase